MSASRPPGERWEPEALFVLDAVRRVRIERSSIGDRRAVLDGDWLALEGRGTMPLLAAIDLADSLESLARKIREHVKFGPP